MLRKIKGDYMDMVKFRYRLDETKLTLNDTSKLDSIALHNTGSDNNIVTDTDWHMDGNKWSWIGYGYWVDKKGNIYECRGFKYQNTAVQDNNSHIVSIAFQGNYNVNYPMPKEQFEAGVELINHIKSKLPNITNIDGHKAWTETDCPGKYFPLQNMISASSTKEEAIMDIDKALDVLVSKGIINTKDYWKMACGVVKYLQELIIKFATYINK